MTLEWLHPGLLLIVGAWVLPLLKGKVKRAAMLVLPAAALIDCFVMRPGTYGVTNFLGQQVVFGRVDRLSLVFSYVFSIMAFIGMLYALHVKDDSQHVAALTYAGSALGVTFAGDFLSLYVFWELMAISSSLLVLLRRETAAVAAGFRYLLVHIFGGLLLLAGIVVHWSQTGSLAFGDMGAYSGGPAWALILAAFLLNAAVPPLGAWLPDAYPEATVTGAVFMTAFTTKSAVYVLLRGFAGSFWCGWARSWRSTASCTPCWKMTRGGYWPTTSSARLGIWFVAWESGARWPRMAPLPTPSHTSFIKRSSSWEQAPCCRRPV